MSLDRSKICHKLKVVGRIQETSDTVSLTFEIPSALKEKFKYRAGQFVTLFLDISRAGKTEEVRRSYSLASSPDFESSFKVAVKCVPGGVASTHLTQVVKAGDEIWVTPPAGLFCLPKQMTEKNLALYAGGSGITPIISLAKTFLSTSSGNCALFYACKDEQNIIFADELKQLTSKFGNRFQLTYILAHPASNWSGARGLCSKNDVSDFLKKSFAGAPALHFICGPSGYMKTVSDSLKDLGVEKQKIFIESFASSGPHESTGASDQNLKEDQLPKFGGREIWIGDKSSRATPQIIEAVVDNKTHEIKAREGSTILETLLEAGLNPPYSCMDGACMACMAKIDSGLAYQNEMGILGDENVEVGECLTCQARPASAKIKINYGQA